MCGVGHNKIFFGGCGLNPGLYGTQAVKATPHINKGKGATLVPSTVKLLHREKEKPMGIKRVAGLA
jgi:hypothetical protein